MLEDEFLFPQKNLEIYILFNLKNYEVLET